MEDLFGEPHRWGQTLRNMLWTHASAVVPAFAANTVFELQVPCTFDFKWAAVKYFQGLADGEIPLRFQFSGTVFYESGDGNMQVAPISWSKEATFRLPVKTWNEMMDLYYPNSAWLCLRRDVFEKLYQHKVRLGVPTWEEMLEGLLECAEEGGAKNVDAVEKTLTPCALRGLHSLSLPPLVGEESETIQLRVLVPLVQASKALRKAARRLAACRPSACWKETWRRGSR